MTPVRHPSLARTVATDPLVLLTGAGTVLVLAWLAWGPAPQVLRALAGPALNAVMVVVALRLARRPGRPAPVRRFWRAMTATGLLFLAGNLSRLAGTLRHPDADAVVAGRFQLVCALAGITVLLAACLAHPLPRTSAPARLRYLLDAGGVVTAAVVAIWFMVDRSAALGVGSTASLVAVVVGLSVTLAVGRLIVSGHSPVSSVAAAPVIASAVVQCFTDALAPAAVGQRGELALQIAASVLVSIAPRLEELAGRVTGNAPAPRRRPYSVLPYGMLGIVFLILPAALPAGLSTTAIVTLAGLVLITLLVVARQLLAFRENVALVGQYDAGLETLGRQEERVRLMLEYSTDITSLIDATGAMIYLTPATTRVLGYEPAEMLGVRVVTLVHPGDLPGLLPDLGRLMATPRSTLVYQARYRHKDGSWRWLEVTSRNLTDEPSVGAVVSNARDVTESRELQDRLQHEATHDALTGLANRVLFGRRLAAAVRDGVALLHIDLDGFKPINDTYGHHAGDVVLVRVAERLTAVLPPGAVAARLGGDEFAVLLPEAGKYAAELVADRFAAALAEPIEVDGRLLTIGASVGVVAGTGVDPEALLREADEAMYRVKHLGV